MEGLFTSQFGVLFTVQPFSGPSRFPYIYSILTLEPLHNLFLAVSKLLEHFKFHYVPLQTVWTKPNGLQTIPLYVQFGQ